MADTSGLVAATAASVAAALSGATLVIASRRDERWCRLEAIIDTPVIFLDASFVRGTRGTVAARQQGEDIAERRGSVEAHEAIPQRCRMPTRDAW